jgi:NADPH:quinone reductase-like Zn-dependent oxidoreductase
MRAARFHKYGDPTVLKVEEVAQPVPANDELLIRVHASSLNPADLGARRGQLRLVHARHLPHIPGYDVAGEVAACGPAATAFVPGERVFALVGLAGGAQAEYVCVNQAKVARAPQHLSLADAAVVPLAGLTALQALRGKAHLQPGQRVLVNGAAGGVGSFAVQLAKVFDCHVTAVCRGTQAQMVTALGADAVIDYTHEDFAARRQSWDVVFDAAGNRTFRDIRRVLTAQGVMVTTRPSPRDLLTASLQRRGAGPRYRFLITRASGQDLALLAHLVDQGRVRPVVDRAFALDHIEDAHRYFEQGQARGKVVVQIQGA